MSTKINRVLMDKDASGYIQTEKTLKKLQDVPVIRSEGNQSESYRYDGGTMGREIAYEPKDTLTPRLGKDTLHLISYKGEFLKPCPGTKEYICCGYQILNVATNCPLDCSYCILQAYFNQPNLRIFVNFEEKIEQIFQCIDAEPGRIFRIGTGEFTDSLALDDVTGLSDELLPLFSARKNVVLELKTKTTNIERLLDSKYRNRIIVSWSLNSPYISAREEHYAATLKQRIVAARKCQEAGFILGFHFDPMISHPLWKEEYIKTIDLLNEYINPQKIIWLSMGSFRYMPALKPIIRRRHPRTCVLNGEFIMGLDGKMRYFKPIRVDLYGFLREKLEEWYPDLGLYLCMESDDVWQEGMGWSPKKNAGLSEYLDNRVVKFFG